MYVYIYVYMYIYICICMHIDAYTYNLLWNIPTNLQARYDVFCVKSAVNPQPTNPAWRRKVIISGLTTGEGGCCGVWTIVNGGNVLEDKREDYQNCSVLCCIVYASCAQWYAHTWAVLKVGLGFFRFRFYFLCVIAILSRVVWFCWVRISFFTTEPRDWLEEHLQNECIVSSGT